MKSKALKIPFHKKDGELCSYAYSFQIDNPLIVWKENFSFEDTLEYVGYKGGRSSMSMELRSKTTGLVYPMFWTFFDRLLRRLDIKPGPTWSGQWDFCKRGKNYSLRPVEAN